MSGRKPFYLTGGNAKIRINNRTIAFCTDISYSVIVNHEAPVVLGMYEGSSLEPTSYEVTGAFTIIKYTAGFSSDITGAPGTVAERGNGVGSWGPDTLARKLAGGLSLSGPDGRAYDSLNPKKLETGAGFDIEIAQKITEADLRSVAKIRNCRITRSDFRLSKSDTARQSFQFRALYVDEDTFLADFSGFGQQFA